MEYFKTEDFIEAIEKFSNYEPIYTKTTTITVPNRHFCFDYFAMEKLLKNDYITKLYPLPRKYIINKKATVLFWQDGDKTIVKLNKDDKYNKRLGFLTAFFQKHSGLTKNQANKYLDSLQDGEDLKNATKK